MWGDQSGSFELARMYTKNNKKFDIPIRPIPWSTDFTENVSFTLEWLIRDHKKDEIRLDDNNVLEHVREFWYRSAHFEGDYSHICFPQDILKFRTEYDSVYSQLINLPSSEMSSRCLGLRDRLRDLLWSGWKCIGIDGIYNQTKGKHIYHYVCNRCGTYMPKAIKAFIELKAISAKVNEDAIIFKT